MSKAQSGSGSGEHPSSEAPPEPATEAVTVSKEELKCTVSGAEKVSLLIGSQITEKWKQVNLQCIYPQSHNKQKRIRKNVYCGQLFDLDERLRSLVPSMCLLRDFGHCVPYYADPGYLTPNQVMESIKLWHQDMVSSHLCIIRYTCVYFPVGLHSMQISTHKKCCESRDSNQNSSRIFSRDLSVLYGSRIDFRIGEMLNMCPFSHAGSLWDGGLSKVALLVHMLELMQGLGRRRTCLRGCVSEGQVVCTDLLPYVL